MESNKLAACRKKGVLAPEQPLWECLCQERWGKGGWAPGVWCISAVAPGFPSCSHVRGEFGVHRHSAAPLLTVSAQHYQVLLFSWKHRIIKGGKDLWDHLVHLPTYCQQAVVVGLQCMDAASSRSPWETTSAMTFSHSFSWTPINFHASSVSAWFFFKIIITLMQVQITLCDLKVDQLTLLFTHQKTGFFPSF